ncbi:hypothetical protein FE257_012486 [Aspergillus nanangensis]|uniref:Transcription factor domain-containing protein n=1 Tax=Aspergillus nanangensis TaxID=2582783 RepID=A0AAD4CUP9_ASPNN|nr:hypothetical protein FE257_012486 [Aspergillus nanangensis]
MEHSDIPGSHKRRRISAMYQRRRAVTACLPCRTRKTKCDNIRPTSAIPFFSSPNANHRSWWDRFDPASLAILERVNHVIELLETPSSKSPHRIGSSGIHNKPDRSDFISSYDDQIANDLNAQDELRVDTPGFPATINSCEGVLRWPIFNNLAPCTQSFVFETEIKNTQTSNASVSLGGSVQDDDMVLLAERFLSYVHIKNPVLNVSGFKRHVRDVAMNGLRWDGQSCLILLACALGCVAVPFNSIGDWEDLPSVAVPQAAHKDSGATYYLAAKKRLGLIEPSWLRIQCLFLCGVFEMYSMRPLCAWEYFKQACGQLENLFWKQSLTTPLGEDDHADESRQLQQRLYWSCMKSEFELRCEIPLPPSGIARFNLSDVLPSPPAEVLLPLSQEELDHGIPVPAVVDHDEERSWFYYLAEISFRRMMDRAFASIGGDGETDWITNFQQLRVRHRLFQEQIEFWCSHIPPPISFNEREELNHELAHHIRARETSFREWIHRPFLYYVVHQPLDDPFVAEAIPLARECLALCVKQQLMIPPHLHHGTWFQARNSMTRALLLIAAAKCGKIELPGNWKQGLDHAFQTLRYWARNAPDLEKAADALQELMDDVVTLL